MPEQSRPKTIDERLEALAEQVELIGHMQLKTEKELRGLTRDTRAFIRSARFWLVNIEERLRDLNGEQDDEEAQ